MSLKIFEADRHWVYLVWGQHHDNQDRDGNQQQQQEKENGARQVSSLLTPVAQFRPLLDSYLVKMLQIVRKVTRPCIPVPGIFLQRAIERFLKVRRN